MPRRFTRCGDADLDQPSGGFRGVNAVALSALFDIVQAGGL